MSDSNTTGAVAVSRPQTRQEVMRVKAAEIGGKLLSKAAREKAINRDIVCNAVTELQVTAGTLTAAVELLLGRAAEGVLLAHVDQALKACATGNSTYPSRSSICLWHKTKRHGGIDALTTQHKGRQRQEGGWEALAVALYNQPSQPAMASIHKTLVEIHGYDCSYAQVQAYINALPAQLGKNSPARLGKNLHRLTQAGYVRRTTENMRPGDIYVADGYRADVYLAHPMSGDVFRPELTVAMDLRSRFIVGWRLDEHEGSFAVQSMWAETFTRHGHVPPFLYVDNGSGYKNSFVDDEITGFYARAGVVQVLHSIPGNPHGKGWIERFFNTMKNDFLKQWQPAFYCGDDMADEVRNKVVREVKAGRLVLPSVQQFSDAFNAWLARYHARPHPEDKQVTHAALWAGLVPIPPAIGLSELKRCAIQLKVRRASVKHKKREYKHADLYAFNGQLVQMEYDLMDNSVGVIRTLAGIWICDAKLITPIDVVPVSRLDEKRLTRTAEAVKRLEKKITEQTVRGGQLIDADKLAEDAGYLTCDYAVSGADDEPLVLDLDLS